MITFFATWFVLAFIALVFNYAIHHNNPEAEAQAVIDATADWFEEVLQTMGITPSCIPTLLRYQAHQHEYLNDD
jgi:hypothetical protein